MHLTKLTKAMAFLLLFSMLMNMILPVSVAAEEMDGLPQEAAPFSCWVMLGEDQIYGVAGEDGKYHLTVPAGTDKAGLEVVYSCGENSVSVPGMFAEGDEFTLVDGEVSYTIALTVKEEPVLPAAEEPVMPVVEETPFSCWIMLGETRINGAAGADGKYYLTAPAGTVAAEVTLNYAGGAMGEGTQANAFAEAQEITLTGSDNATTYTVVLVVEEEEEIPFNCWIESGENKILGVLSAEDGKYYLNAPARTVAAEVTLNYAGGAMGEGTQANAFAEAQEVTLTGSDNATTYTVVLVVEEKEETPFSCWTMNGETRIEAVATEGNYVLTVPYDMEQAKVVVYFTGTVTAASVGILSETVVTGAFANGKEVTLTGSDAETVYTIVLVVEDAPEEEFSCWIGSGEEKIQGVLSSEDGKYHLEVPANLDRDNTALNFTGVIAATTAGILGEGTVTGAFADVTEVILTGSKAETTYTVVLNPYPVDDRDFSCFTFDEKENQIDGFWDEEDGIWYLFVPSTVNIADMTLSYTGSITEASVGGAQIDIFESCITDAFSQSGDQIVLKDVNGAEYAVQVMQSNLPSVHIVLNEITLDDVHQDKDAKHKNNSIYIMDPSGTYDLAVEDSVEMKGRGNSTWQFFDKKPYQIKFDSKTSVLGMGKAKKWVLLANAADDSMMRNALTYRMAEKMDMAFVTDLEYVDLWVNGEYLGTYTIGEKVEPGSSRLDLKNDLGVLFEQDDGFYMEEDYWFFSEMLQRHFVMKEIVEEEDAYIETAMADFEESVDDLVEFLYTTPASDVTLEYLGTMIDVDSFIKYYLVNEYVLNKEAWASSFYWYKDGLNDVIHLGPVWDFDTSMGNEFSLNTENYATKHTLFHYLMAIPEFYERTLELEQVYKTDLNGITADIDVLKALINDSATMNYLRWDALGKPNGKPNHCDFKATFDDAVSTLQNWLRGRETAFTVRESETVACVVSDDYSRMEICLKDGEPYSKMSFAVWGASNREDLTWYTGQQQADGSFKCVVDLTKHNHVGIYSVHAYANDAHIATGYPVVRQLYNPEPMLMVTLAHDCSSMELVLKNASGSKNVWFPVWSVSNGQDDIIWYRGQKQADGSFIATVDLTVHGDAGTYSVHAYGGTTQAENLLAHTTANVAKKPVANFTATVSSDCTTMELVLKDASGSKNVWFPVWSVTNGQDDIVWYRGQKQADGSFAATVDLTAHGDAGTYVIHVYGGANQAEELLTHGSAYVAKKPVANFTATVSSDCTAMELVLKNAEGSKNVWFPVWSATNGQDDTIWYRGQKQADGSFTATVDLTAHGDAGTYVIHVYGGANQAEELLTHGSAYVAKKPVANFTATVSSDCTAMELVLKDAEGSKNVWFPVWSATNGQDDIVWYRGQEQADGSFTATVDLTAHGDVGTYVIHVYGGTTKAEKLLTHTTAYVAQNPSDAYVAQNPLKAFVRNLIN